MIDKCPMCGKANLCSTARPVIPQNEYDQEMYDLVKYTCLEDACGASGPEIRLSNTWPYSDQYSFKKKDWQKKN